MMTTEWLEQLRKALGPRHEHEYLNRFVAVHRECDRLRRQTWRMAALVVLSAASGLAVVSLLLALVVPELGQALVASGLRLNPAGRALEGAASLGRGFWLVLAAGFVLLGYSPWIFRRPAWNRMPRLPMIGSIWRAIDEAQWSHMLAMFVEMGYPWQQALQHSGELAAQGGMNQRGLRWATQLEAGDNWRAVIESDATAPAHWRLLSPNNGAPPSRLLRQSAGLSAGRAGMRLALLKAAIWPVLYCGGLVMGLAVTRALLGPILAYLRTWA
ncbi:MAG: hypothetical protein AB7O62_08320 [Pirellulales bacterium]